MLQIKDTLVSLDLLERSFCCDMKSCKGECCIDGDAGAPVTEEEVEKIKSVLPVVSQYLLPSALSEIEANGVAYVDQEGDLVTSLVNSAQCVFTIFDSDGMCLCALEKAYREGLTDFRKPMSCYLYPVRVKQYPSFTAVNYHRWKICKCAEVLGRKLNLRAYEFLREPLIERFGKDWYDELSLTAEEYFKQYGDSAS